MKLYLHQKNNNINDLQRSIGEIERVWKNNEQSGLHLFPELFLGGYPLQDICLQREFIVSYLKSLKSIQELSSISNNKSILFGGLDYQLGQHKEINKIFNCIYLLDNSGLKVVYRKRLLPNYDIYDEKKYFSPGFENCFIEINGHRFCLLICEDMWHSSAHDVDPVDNAYQEFIQQGLGISGIINLSASPFNISKQQKRLQRAKEISHSFKAPFIYVNQIGLNDEILFDGQSFIINENDIYTAGAFLEEVLEFEISTSKNISQPKNIHQPSIVENTWEGLFKPQIENNKFKKLTDSELQEILIAQTFGLNQYAIKTKMKSYLVALSGGIDSAVVLAVASLAAKASNMTVEAIYMPSQYNSPLSYELSQKMCENLGIKLKVINLKFIHQTIKMTFKESVGIDLEGLANENIQSRLRGNLIYARSNQNNGMVINTSNKSELAVGYSTLYGDSVGALSILGDLFKTEVYQLAKFINQHFNHIIPEEIINRPPSAELREDQKDEDSLPPYDRLDLILEAMLSYQYSMEDIIQLGVPKEEVEKVNQLFYRSEFKRFQFCPILKLKGKSFGFGHRLPILKNE